MLKNKFIIFICLSFLLLGSCTNERIKEVEVYKGTQDQNKEQIIIDDYISYLHFSFSPNGKDYSFSAKNKENKWIIVSTDFGIIDKYDFQSKPTYGPDGKELSYIASKNGETFLIKGGVKINNFEYLIGNSSYESYLPGGEDYGFSFHAKSAKDEHVGVAYRGKGLHELLYSNNEKHFAYGFSKDGKDYISLDGKISQGYDDIIYYIFSPDSSRFIYVIKENELLYIVENDKKSKAYQHISDLQFTGDSQHLIFLGSKPGGKELLIIDYNENQLEDGLVSNLISNSNGDIAYSLYNDGKAIIYYNNSPLLNYHKQYSPIFSKFNNDLIYLAENLTGEKFIVNNDNSYSADAIKLRYSPYSNSYVYYQKKDNAKGKYKIIKDGESIGFSSYGTNFLFSPDSKGYTYFYSNDIGYYLNISGEIFGPYEDIINLHYNNNGSMLYTKIKENNKWKIVIFKI